MKKIALKSVPSLAKHVDDLDREPVVLTDNGRAVAAIVALPNADAESVDLSSHPGFMAIIERSRRRHRREGGISPAEMRRRLGIGQRSRGARGRRRSNS